jgi:hypothetical protein
VLWEVAGGYEHAQPGSRLIQYGEHPLPLLLLSPLPSPLSPLSL